MFKKRYLILITIICLFLISSVSAQEINNNTNTIERDYDSSLIAESADDNYLIMSEDFHDHNDGDQLSLTNYDNVNESSESDLLSYVYDARISAPGVSKYYNGPERFVVTLRNSYGYLVMNELIKITINGNTYNRYTDENGQASIALNLNAGVYDVITDYNNKRIYSTVTIKNTVIANDFTKMYKSPTQYSGTFLDSNGQRLPQNSPIKININGVFYTRYTDSNGIASMNINLNPGNYILTATNPSTGEMRSTKITVRSKIVNNYDLTKYYKSNSQYSIRLLGDNGNPVGAGVPVTFNINGVFYTRTSDSNGYVSMNINLNPGQYIITADYNGCKASNTIKVLSTLSANDLYMSYKDGSSFNVKVLNGNGNPYSGQTVTFNINGVFYNRVTDSNGIARLNINLPPGSYIITSSFNGLNLANNIVIKENTNNGGSSNSGSNSNSGGNTYNKDSGYVYIDLPSYDTTITKKVGLYTIKVEQWRSPRIAEVDIMVTDQYGNMVDTHTVESKISDGSTWSDTYKRYERATYHKWQFDPDVRITKVAVQLLGTHWS